MLYAIQNINGINSTVPSFRKQKKIQEPVELGDDNPISRKGEVMNLIKTTFVGGLALGGYLLMELVENGEFAVETLFNYSEKLAKTKNKKEIEKIKKELETKKKAARDARILNTLGIFAALVAVGISGFALLYTLFHAPKIAYESKVNTFTKGKEMDVYIKANEAERELYAQLDEKAQNATPEEKEKLKTQYMQMVNAKNQVPDYVNLKR